MQAGLLPPLLLLLPVLVSPRPPCPRRLRSPASQGTRGPDARPQHPLSPSLGVSTLGDHNRDPRWRQSCFAKGHVGS